MDYANCAGEKIKANLKEFFPIQTATVQEFLQNPERDHAGKGNYYTLKVRRMLKCVII